MINPNRRRHQIMRHNAKRKERRAGLLEFKQQVQKHKTFAFFGEKEA